MELNREQIEAIQNSHWMVRGHIRALTEENERLRVEKEHLDLVVEGKLNRIQSLERLVMKLTDKAARAKADTVREMQKRIKQDAASVALLSNPPKFMLEIREDALDQIAKELLE